MDTIYRVSQRRWACPHCKTEGWETGHERVSPRYDHDRPDGRYCRKAARREDTIREREAKALREASERLTYPACLVYEFERFAKLKAWETDLSKVRLTLRISRGRIFNWTNGPATRGKPKFWSSGRAFSDGRIVITAGTDPVDARLVLLHELAHQAVYARPHHARGEDYRPHGSLFAAFFADACEEVLGEKLAVRYWYSRSKGSEQVSREAFQVRADAAMAVGSFLRLASKRAS